MIGEFKLVLKEVMNTNLLIVLNIFWIKYRKSDRIISKENFFLKFQLWIFSDPSEQDILRCRVMTTGIFETKFEVDKVRFQ